MGSKIIKLTQTPKLRVLHYVLSLFLNTDSDEADDTEEYLEKLDNFC